MTISSPAGPRDARPALGAAESNLAPRWHTAALIGVIIAVAAAGTLMRVFRPTPPPSAHAPGASVILAVYFPMVLVQGGLAFYVCRVGRARSALSPLLGRRWMNVRDALADAALAALGWLSIMGCEAGWRAIARSGVSASIATILPHTMPERLGWVAVALSVGVSEELVYRGYLQAQLAAFTRRPNLATLLQAALFGIAHLEQGTAAALRLGLYGVFFGVLARSRRNLLPCILCHAGTDLVSGLIQG